MWGSGRPEEGDSQIGKNFVPFNIEAFDCALDSKIPFLSCQRTSQPGRSLLEVKKSQDRAANICLLPFLFSQIHVVMCQEEWQTPNTGDPEPQTEPET